MWKLLLLKAALVLSSAQAAGPVPPPRFELPSDSQGGAVREVLIDLAPFTGASGRERVAYSLDEVLRPLTVAELADLPDWALAVRLQLGEIGASRLHMNQWGVLEGLALIETVKNRLDPKLWNPAGVSGAAPWPGCGSAGTFGSCANPGQYYALRDRRALDPRAAVRSEQVLLDAIDVAVTAWWVSATNASPEVANGATSFVHRCGGTAYGQLTPYCDGRRGVPDLPGAEGATGPLVLKGPGGYDRRSGSYTLEVRRVVDYKAGPRPTTAGAFASYLWGATPTAGWTDEHFDTDPTLLAALWKGEEAAIDDLELLLPESVDAEEDEALLEDTGFAPYSEEESFDEATQEDHEHAAAPAR